VNRTIKHLKSSQAELHQPDKDNLTNALTKSLFVELFRIHKDNQLSSLLQINNQQLIALDPNHGLHRPYPNKVLNTNHGL
jgi:hypothetical protein